MMWVVRLGVVFVSGVLFFPAQGLSRTPLTPFCAPLGKYWTTPNRAFHVAPDHSTRHACNGTQWKILSFRRPDRVVCCGNRHVHAGACISGISWT